MAASGNSRGHVCLRVGETINRTPASALGRRSRTGSVALNLDRRIFLVTRLERRWSETASGFPLQSLSNVCLCVRARGRGGRCRQRGLVPSRIEPSVSAAPYTKLDLVFATYLRASTYGESVGQTWRVWMTIGGALGKSVAREGLPGLLVLEPVIITPTSDQARLRPELKHITKGRKRN